MDLRNMTHQPLCSSTLNPENTKLSDPVINNRGTAINRFYNTLLNAQQPYVFNSGRYARNTQLEAVYNSKLPYTTKYSWPKNM